MFWPLLYLFVHLASPYCDPTDGLVQIDENLYCDKREITNKDYKEYIWWMRRIFGEESDMWLKALPGEVLIDTITHTRQIKPSEYFLNEAFLDYPVVFVSFEQANNYCQWRADRIMERILFTYDMIEYDTAQNKSTFFTAKKYLDTQPQTCQLRVGVFRLPTPEEWKKIAQHKKTNKEFVTEYTAGKQTDLLRVYNLFGNVSEMTSVKGLSMGGSYADYSEEDPTTNYEFPYDGPSEKVGFRCVCTIEEMTGGGKAIEK